MSIKNKAIIDSIFKDGKTISNNLVMFKYLESNLGILFCVSSKRFKRAVDRNRIKRLMRQGVSNLDINKTVAIIYIGDVMPNYKELSDCINTLNNKIN